MGRPFGLNLRVTGYCDQGDRKYMEDVFSVAYQSTQDKEDVEYAFFGIFDGHGGREAAIFAKENLMDYIVKQKGFWAENDDESVLGAIREGFVQTHYAMWRKLDKWPKTLQGLPSTAGTTASVAFIKRGKIYIGHVGDSAIVLGKEDVGQSEGAWKATLLTRDHKPESDEESKRIQRSGGKVICKSGVPRVVWNRPKKGHKGPVRRSTAVEEVPFLAVARSLGDFWSYNSEENAFVVSPEPDTHVYPLDIAKHRCLILGTDGAWNMITPTLAVSQVYYAEKSNEQLVLFPKDNDKLLRWINPSKHLVDRAIERWWSFRGHIADNTSIVTVMLDPPGLSRAKVLKNRKDAALLNGEPLRRQIYIHGWDGMLRPLKHKYAGARSINHPPSAQKTSSVCQEQKNGQTNSNLQESSSGADLKSGVCKKVGKRSASSDSFAEHTPDSKGLKSASTGPHGTMCEPQLCRQRSSSRKRPASSREGEQDGVKQPKRAFSGPLPSTGCLSSFKDNESECSADQRDEVPTFTSKSRLCHPSSSIDGSRYYLRRPSNRWEERSGHKVSLSSDQSKANPECTLPAESGQDPSSGFGEGQISSGSKSTIQCKEVLSIDSKCSSGTMRRKLGVRKVKPTSDGIHSPSLLTRTNSTPHLSKKLNSLHLESPYNPKCSRALDSVAVECERLNQRIQSMEKEALKKTSRLHEEVRQLRSTLAVSATSRLRRSRTRGESTERGNHRQLRSFSKECRNIKISPGASNPVPVSRRGSAGKVLPALFSPPRKTSKSPKAGVAARIPRQPKRSPVQLSVKPFSLEKISTASAEDKQGKANSRRSLRRL